MPIFERWSIVKVPFPYTDRTTTQRRPALVVATGADLAASHLLWALMITSAENRGWACQLWTFEAPGCLHRQSSGRQKWLRLKSEMLSRWGCFQKPIVSLYSVA